MKKIYNSTTGEIEEQSEGRQAPVRVEPTRPLIEAFCNTYKPCNSEVIADEIFTLGRLRDYFKCYAILDPRWVDIFPKYLDALSEQGYKVQTSFSGEPAIFVSWPAPPRPTDYNDDDDFDNNE